MINSLKYLYKYQAIRNKKNLIDDYSIRGILNNTAVFSTRKNFNDLFDSKIELVPPSIKELADVDRVLIALKKASPNGKFENGEKIPNSIELSKQLKIEINEIIDNFIFYCLSNKPESNLMWSHYSDSHKGFCIEFKTEFVKADKVTYLSTIPKLKIMDLFRLKFNPDQPEINTKIWKALRTKLLEWKYEEEYRFQASKGMLQGITIEDGRYAIIPYSRNFINSIIFGCRMPKTTKEFIIKKMGGCVKYKQAVEKLSRIEICPY